MAICEYYPYSICKLSKSENICVISKAIFSRPITHIGLHFHYYQIMGDLHFHMGHILQL